MKTLKQFLLPAVLVVAGVGAAFATSTSAKTAAIPMQGYYFDNSQPLVKCIRTSVECETTPGPVCTWFDGTVTHNLQQRVNDASCGLPLYRK